MFDFKDYNVLIVGGTSGIGYATAFAFAELGANVVATSLDSDGVRSTTKALKELGTTTFDVECDATQPQSVTHLIERISSEWGHVDVLMNCQGIHHKIPSQDVTDDAFHGVMSVNLESVFRVCREAFPLLKGSPHASIINIGSMGSFIGLKHAAAYNASKSAIAGLTRTLAVDWAEEGIRCNAILSAPALSKPEYRDPILRRIPLQRFGDPQDVAGAALFLASDYARYITGTVLTVDGGVLASV